MIFKRLFFICSLTAAMLYPEPLKTIGVTPSMPYTMETQGKKLVIGMKIRTDNDQCQKDIPEVWVKFFKAQIPEKIPHKVGKNLLAVYTEYESDYTKPYSYIVGCEVSTLDEIPEGLVGIVVPQSSYAVFITEGPFPQGLAQTWQMIWKTPLKRAYTSDFEIYGPDFNPQTNPEVKVFIAL